MRFFTYSCLLLSTVVIEILCLYDPSTQPLPLQPDTNTLIRNYHTYNRRNTTWNYDKTCHALYSYSVDILCTYEGEDVPCLSEMKPGTTATLACKDAYKIENINDTVYDQITCTGEGSWDQPPFECVPECGLAISHGRTLIVNGITSKHGVFPWHVAIFENYTSGSYQQICGGSLISADLIVSAAHCFYDETTRSTKRVTDFAIAAGKHYRLYNWPEQFVQKSLVETIDISERYYGIPGNHAVDIALVRVQTPFNLNTLVRPICMDWANVYQTEHLQAGSVGKAAGWGVTARGHPSNELQEISLPYVSHQQCMSAVPDDFRGFITYDKFCAGYLNGSSLCNGDSGGGLSFKIGDLWYLRGIVSVAPTSLDVCDNRYYTAFTNVGDYRNWIRDAFKT